MLITRIRQLKNKRAITLVEMIAAVAITGILAAVLSMMIVPIMNTYKLNATKVELAQATTARLNDIALFLRGAKGVYLSTATRNVTKVWYPRGKSNSDKNNYFSDTNTAKMYLENDYVFPEIRWQNTYTTEPQKTRYVEFDGLQTVMGGSKRCYCFVMDNYHERNSGIKGYLYPELVIADWSDDSKRYLAYASYADMKLSSDDYQSKEYWCPSVTSMYFKVKRNPDDSDRKNVLEVHLTVQSGSVSYEGVKTIVCENLVIKQSKIYTVNFMTWENGKLQKKSPDLDTKYYTVWFSMLD